MKTILSTTPNFNPMFCNGKVLEFIEITQNGQPIATINHGWFNSIGTSNNHYKEIHLPFEVLNKRAYSTKKEAFIIKCKNDYKSGYKLVLPIELLPFAAISKDVKGYKSEKETQYFDRITFSVLADKLELSKDEIKGFVWKRSGLKECSIHVDFNYRYNLSESGAIRDNIIKKAESVGVSLSDRDVKQLLSVLNISLK